MEEIQLEGTRLCGVNRVAGVVRRGAVQGNILRAVAFGVARLVAFGLHDDIRHAAAVRGLGEGFPAVRANGPDGRA